MFDDGRGPVIDGGRDWTLDFRISSPSDDSWLDKYRYELGNPRWVLRDVGAESPFADAMGGLTPRPRLPGLASSSEQCLEEVLTVDRVQSTGRLVGKNQPETGD